MRQDDHRNQCIAALKWRIAKLDGQSEALIQFRAGLSPINEFTKREFIQNEIEMKIADIADLRSILNDLTGLDSGEIS